MRVLLCGGGTAGHVNPAIAIGEIIERNEPESKIAYVVTKNGIENELVKYKKYTIEVKGLKKGVFSNVRRLILLSKAIKECKKIINAFRPDIIIGTGGYATFPVIYAGQKMGIKTLLHESNYYPGKAIKALYKKADLVLVNFKETINLFKRKDNVIYVGNPLRKGFESLNKTEVKKRLGIGEKYVILACGGSLGAEKLNEAIIDLIDNYIKYNNDIRLLWSTGKRNYNSCREKLSNRRLDKLKNIEVVPYIYDMSDKMACADVVISRAGAMSISEISACKKCSILIPSPNVANDNQYKNALLLEQQNATMLIKEDNIYLLTETVKSLITDENLRMKIENNVKEFYTKDTNKKIYTEIKKLRK